MFARWLVQVAALTVLVLLAVPTVAVGQGFEDVEIQTVDLGDGLALLVGRGGNIGVSVGPDGVFLIDDQYAPLTEKIRAAVAALSSEPIRFVLNTHWHADHTGGNENLGTAGALIVAHDNVRVRMSSDQFIAAMNRTVPASPAAALPVVTFDATITLHWNGHEIHAFHVDPAHTDGDSIVHIRDADVIHMGDTFFNGMYPFIDLSSGGSVAGMIAAAGRALALCGEKTRVIPGHGPLATCTELEAYRAMLSDIHDRVKALKDAGKSLAEAIAAKPTAAHDAAHSGGFIDGDTFVRIVYASLPGA